jgi:predicted nucleotidyltransferase
MLYLDLFEALTRRRVRYVLVGGLALNLRGVERSTMDVDLAIALDRENVSAMLDVAEELRLVPVARVKLRDAENPETLQRWRKDKHMVAFGLRPVVGVGPVVDVLIDLRVPFESLLARSTSRRIDEVDVVVASIDDLIAMKRAAGRPIDLADIEALESIKRMGLDQ